MQKVIISITVDWECENFRNLSDLLELRRKIGKNIPLTYFICPAYFTKGIKNAASKIKSAVFDIDEIGIHVHSFRSLIKEAGVEFRTKPDFFHRFTPEVEIILKSLPQIFSPKNTGRGVPLSAYNFDEIIKILDISRKIVSENLNIADIYGFRAGGWMANDDVFEALIKTGFSYDSTAAPPEVLSQGFSSTNLGSKTDDYGENHNEFTDYIIKMWGTEIQSDRFLKNSLFKEFCTDVYITRFTQPFKIKSLVEMPNNSSMSDYVSVETMRSVLDKGIAEIKAGRSKPFFLNTGFHQEGDIKNKIPIFDFINSITDEEMEFIEFKTVNDARRMVIW